MIQCHWNHRSSCCCRHRHQHHHQHHRHHHCVLPLATPHHHAAFNYYKHASFYGIQDQHKIALFHGDHHHHQNDDDAYVRLKVRRRWRWLVSLFYFAFIWLTRRRGGRKEQDDHIKYPSDTTITTTNATASHHSYPLHALKWKILLFLIPPTPPPPLPLLSSHSFLLFLFSH